MQRPLKAVEFYQKRRPMQSANYSSSPDEDDYRLLEACKSQSGSSRDCSNDSRSPYRSISRASLFAARPNQVGSPSERTTSTPPVLHRDFVPNRIYMYLVQLLPCRTTIRSPKGSSSPAPGPA